MTYKEVYDSIKDITISTGVTIPVAYYQFPADDPQNPPPPPPFLVYYYDGSDDFSADNKNYQKIRPLTIELYTDNKNFTIENAVESKLIANGFVFSRTEDYIDSEKLYMITYETEVLING